VVSQKSRSKPIRARSKPTDQPSPAGAVTQDLLNAATTAVPASGRPQIKCEVDS
jgi:hypothetical protein